MENFLLSYTRESRYIVVAPDSSHDQQASIECQTLRFDKKERKRSRYICVKRKTLDALCIN